MAILLLKSEVFTNKSKMIAYRDYFTEFTFIEQRDDQKKYYVYKADLPYDNTQVECSLTEAISGVWEVTNVKTLGRKI